MLSSISYLNSFLKIIWEKKIPPATLPPLEPDSAVCNQVVLNAESCTTFSFSICAVLKL